jgi:hypothetical protein
MTRTERIRHVVLGVIRQIIADAQAQGVTVIGNGTDADLLRVWCLPFEHENGLRVHAANKTALLLGESATADILPLGDLYASQVVELAGAVTMPDSVGGLIHACGGIEAVDRALANRFERRISWTASTTHLSAEARDRLAAALEAARFQRQRVALIPKLSSRTLGIDLYA